MLEHSFRQANDPEFAAFLAKLRVGDQSCYDEVSRACEAARSSNEKLSATLIP